MQLDKELEVLKLRKQGLSYSEICKKLGMHKSLVAYYSKKHTIEEKLKSEKEKDEQTKEYEMIICENVYKATSISNLCKILGKRPTNNNLYYINKIIEKYNIDISHFLIANTKKHINIATVSHAAYFVLDETKLKQSAHVKNRILKYNIKEYKCEQCHNTIWNNRPIPLELHHINGNRFDNRLENLQLLCPNCHAQTDNYAGKNKNKKAYICKQCGNTFYIGNGSTKTSTLYCSVKCREQSFQNKNINKPSAEQLIQNYKQFGSFIKIGTLYNVSDNTVKKWFKLYGLPSDVHSIRKYIIEKYGKQPQWYSYMYDENGCRKNMKYKAIDVFSKDNTFIKTYQNIHEVLKDLELPNAEGVRAVCNGKHKQYCGYIFKYH